MGWASDEIIKIVDSVEKDFSATSMINKDIKRFLKLLDQKKITFDMTREYAQNLGKILGQSIEKYSKDLSIEVWNEIASDILTPLLAKDHNLVMVASEEVQKIIDDADGIKLGAVRPKVDKHSVDNIVKKVTSHDDIGIAMDSVKKNVQTFTESSFDSFIQSNAAFRYDAGMSPQIIRTYEGAHKEHTNHKDGGNLVDCQWCKNLAGVYDYNEVKDTGNDVFRRHEGCHCTVIYKNNVKRYLQNAHSKSMIRK